MKCINCGADIQDTALFCNYCGQKQGVMINEDFDPDKTVSVFDNPLPFAQSVPTPPVAPAPVKPTVPVQPAVTPQPAVKPVAPVVAPQPAVKPAVPVATPKQEGKKGLFGFFKKQAPTVAPAKPVAPTPTPVAPAEVVPSTVVEPAVAPVPEPTPVVPQPVAVSEPVVVVPVAEEPVKKAITDKDIYEMAQRHTPHDLTAPETLRVFNAVLSQLVPAYTGVENLETAMLSTPPADIKKNIANADNDTLFVAIKALNYKLSQGCNPAVLSHVIQRIYKVLKARLS